MRATENVRFTALTATTALFELKGGRYMMDAEGTFGGHAVTLQMVGADGTTLLSTTGTLSAAGLVVPDLPPGQYQFTLGSGMTLAVQITRVPLE